METRADNAPNNASSHPEGGQWMTYDEFAAARGIDRRAAVKLVLRQGWQRQRGRDRIARVHVPHGWVIAKPASGGFEAAASHADHTRAVERSMWREQLARERERADTAERERDRLLSTIDGFEGRLARADARADQAEQTLAAQRARTDALTGQLREISQLLSLRLAKKAGDRTEM